MSGPSYKADHAARMASRCEETVVTDGGREFCDRITDPDTGLCDRPSDHVEEETVTDERCELSGHVVTAIPHDDWADDRPYCCHLCGVMVTYRIRGTDLPGQARLHTHNRPKR